MSWKNLTFILIPHSQSNIRQFKVPRAVLFSFAVFLIAAIGIMIFYIVGFQSKSFQVGHTREIERQNILLEKIVGEIDSSLTMMNAKMDSIESLAEKIRLESKISDKDLKLDKGTTVQLSESGVGLPLGQVIGSINQLEKRSRVFEYNFNSLFTRAMSQVDFLRRMPSIRPAQGYITRDFNFRQHENDRSLITQTYSGCDITNDEGTPIMATADGVVKTIDFSDDLGRYIEIDHQNGYKTRYTHLASERGILVKLGQEVKRGQVIGRMGRTGIPIKAIAPHIMYSVEHNGTFVNPADYFYASDYGLEDQAETLSQQNQALPAGF